MPKEILFEVAQDVATITLNRPERLNAWTPTMADEVRAAIGEAGNDPKVRVIVITGAGRGFCAGADMGILADTAKAGKGSAATILEPKDVSFANAPGPDLSDEFRGRFTYMFECPKPIITAINGACVGIGLVFALHSDLRFVADNATLSTTFASRGLIAEHGISWLLPRMIGETAAMDLLLTARKFKGKEAGELGLVNATLPDADLMPHVRELATDMAQNLSPQSLAIIKRQVRLAQRQSFADAVTLANEEMTKSFQSADFREGITAFGEKRPPNFLPLGSGGV